MSAETIKANYNRNRSWQKQAITCVQWVRFQYNSTANYCYLHFNIVIDLVLVVDVTLLCTVVLAFLLVLCYVITALLRGTL